MKYIDHGAGGAPTVLTLRDGATLAAPAAGEITIRVAYAGVNRPDCLQRSGLYPPPSGASPILGLECAGEVVAVGAGVTQWRVGDRVCALCNGGAYAERVNVPAAQCLPIPAGLSMIEAASLPENWFTVFHNVAERGALRAGETILIHGGTSGIGLAAIQLATSLGATVVTTVGSEEKAAFVRTLGATAINYKTEDFVSRIAALKGGQGVDVILDMVGGDYIDRNVQCLAADGRLVQIAFLQSSKANVNFRDMMVKRLTLTGSTLRPRSAEFKAHIARELLAKVWPQLAAMKIKTVIYKEFDWSEAGAAHALMESSVHIGKIMLRVSGEN
jgi:NADPH:quinone reductase